MAERDQRPHLSVDTFQTTETFRGKSAARQAPAIKKRARARHGKALLAQLQAIEPNAERLAVEQHALALDAPVGIYLTFESEPGFELKTPSLDRTKARIELLSVRSEGKRILATVFVPEGQLPVFEGLVTAYLEKDNVNTKTGKTTGPRNNELIANIRSIRQAALKHLWTDDPALLPVGVNEVIWWEVWLRVGLDRVALANFFRQHATAIGLEVSGRELVFPERTVLAVRGTKDQMTRSVQLLNTVAELRKLKDTAEFFTGLPAKEQWLWSEDLLRRAQPPARDSLSVCILDTGMNAHPLLVPAIAPNGCHSINPSWGTNDTFGHGTQMAGLALFGDLVHVLPESAPIPLSYQLESVKLLRHNHDNEGELYGALTREAIARAEQAAVERERVFCLAVSASAKRDRGRPSTWSAALDAITSGAEDEKRRLVVVAGGNVLEADHGDYPATNTTDGIHDPGQSWNALTVGACTFKDEVDPEEAPGASVLAPVGGLSPYSCTSGSWATDWPLKPDVVFEGGNRVRQPDGATESLRSLDLLTVHHQFVSRPFDTFWGTSAATALASRMSARIAAQYPDYWPETIRALMVHSADWTASMLRTFTTGKRKRDIGNLIRHCGFGVPSLERAVWSAGDALTLVAQQEVQPYEAVRNAKGAVSRTRSREMQLYELPWPIDQLRDLGDLPVELRVTLSYFIEPNPSDRGWATRYRYESHGLRFAVKNPLESTTHFRHRINAYALAEESGQTVSVGDDGWIVGPQLRHRGSLHADRWCGPASDLADRGAIAVYPTLGWWRELKRHERFERSARYSLVVSILAPEATVDLYAAIEATIQAKVAVTV
jgi:hypothetical protein